jgi:hypothetical protein
MAAAQGERIAGFILITGIDGIRYVCASTPCP